MDDNRKILVGHFHIDYAYGGVMLCRTVNDGGGVSSVLSSGHTSKRDLYDQIYAFIRGIELMQEQAAK
jgi:hypothetical protein